MARNPVGIYHRGDEIVYYGRRRNGKDIPNTKWAPITARVQRTLLDETDEYYKLTFSQGRVRRRSANEINQRRAALEEIENLAWLNGKRRQALIEVLIDELNKLGADPVLDTNKIEEAYLIKLSS